MSFYDNMSLTLSLLPKKTKRQELLCYAPIAQGHLLIIPRRHIERFEKLTDSEILAISAFSPDYVLIQKNGEPVAKRPAVENLGPAS